MPWSVATAPVTSLTGVAAEFTHVFPPYSLSVMRLSLAK